MRRAIEGTTRSKDGNSYMKRRGNIRGRRPGPLVGILSLCALLLVGTLTLGGCGNLVAGGVNGEASVAVSGDAPEPTEGADGTARSPRSSGTVPAKGEGIHPTETTESIASLEGRVEVRVRFFLESEDPDAVPLALSDDEIHVDVDLSGNEAPEATRRTVPAGRYTGLRMTFSEVTAEVEAGLPLLDPLPTVVRVELGGDDLTLTESADVTVPDGDRADLLVDLNSSIWLQHVDPVTGMVPANEFVNAVEVRVQ